jgi:hypothetical protein
MRIHVWKNRAFADPDLVVRGWIAGNQRMIIFFPTWRYVILDDTYQKWLFAFALAVCAGFSIKISVDILLGGGWGDWIDRVYFKWNGHPLTDGERVWSAFACFVCACYLGFQVILIVTQKHIDNSVLM